jgi:hypothetical protein
MYVGRRTSPVPGILLALAIPVLVAAGIGVRMWVWPARGFGGDLDRLVLWVNGIAVNGWQHAYDTGLALPPVMAWVWGALAWVEPAFRTVADASDPAISALMKISASLADIAIAVAVGWWFRDRAWAAAAAMGAVLLWPVTWYVSAWWGQVEAIHVLLAVIALLAARARRPSLVAVFLALCLMTDLGALPLIVPFAAWFLATQGLRGSLKGAVVGALTCVLVWLPFIPANGPANMLASLAEQRAGIVDALSLGAWNPWWIVQQLGAGGVLAGADTQVLGPITLRHAGIAVAALLTLVVFAGVYRRPSPQGLALGLASVTLVSSVSLTAMDARDAYAAFVFLLMAANGRVLAIAWGAFSIAFAANLLFAAPPPELALPGGQGLGVAGAVAITLVAIVALLWLGLAERDEHVGWDQPLHSLWPTNR